jgi:hypothetical protein
MPWASSNRRKIVRQKGVGSMRQCKYAKCNQQSELEKLSKFRSHWRSHECSPTATGEKNLHPEEREARGCSVTGSAFSMSKMLVNHTYWAAKQLLEMVALLFR